MTRIGLTIATAAALLSACGDGGGSYDGGYGGAPDFGSGRWSDLGAAAECQGANDCPPNDFCNSFHQCVPIPPGDPGGGGDDGGVGGPPALPPEQKLSTEAPASGKRFVYVAIASQDTVVKIDSLPGGRAVRTIAVGHLPGQLHTMPGQDVALVLNRGSDSATLLRSHDDGSDDVSTFPTAPGLNALTVSPDGRYGIAFFDLDASGGVLAPKQTFQEVTLFAVAAAGKEQAINLSVGFKPSEIQYAPDGGSAYIVTEEGVSVLPLAQVPKPGIVPTVPLRKDPLAEPPPSRVLITPDSKYALALIPQMPGVRVVTLAGGTITDLAMSGEATDLAVTPSGKLALATLRDKQSVAFFDLPGALTDPKKIDEVSIGKYVAGQVLIAADGAHALLYTNAVDQKVLMVADLVSHAIKVLPLKKGIRGALLSPDGKAAVVLHNKVPGTPSQNDTLEQYLDKLEGYSLFDVATGYAKLQPTDAPPGDIAFAPDSKSAYLLLHDPTQAVRSVEALDLTSFLVTSVPLGSPPVAVGVVPTTRQVYVAQDHALGRMTFIDADTFTTRTLTGFALNGEIIE